MTELPPRPGGRPEARPGNPHQQLTQNAPADLQERLWQRMTGLDHVRTGRSVISLPDTRALHLEPQYAGGPATAFTPGSTEFAHLHGVDDGSLHLCLPEDQAVDAIAQGWAEYHPAVLMGMLPPTLVMVYGPRDDAELDVVAGFVERSYAYARGL
jgi:Family of unknown function (DUF5519)